MVHLIISKIGWFLCPHIVHFLSLAVKQRKIDFYHYIDLVSYWIDFCKHYYCYRFLFSMIEKLVVVGLIQNVYCNHNSEYNNHENDTFLSWINTTALSSMIHKIKINIRDCILRSVFFHCINTFLKLIPKILIKSINIIVH